MRVFKMGDPVIIGPPGTKGKWFVYYIDPKKGTKQYVCRLVDKASAEWRVMYHKLDEVEAYMYEEDDYESYEVIWGGAW